MATKNTKGSFGGGKVKFRVIEFELEGSDETMQDSLKSIAAALMRGPSVPSSRQLRNDAQTTTTTPSPEVADEVLPEDEDSEPVDAPTRPAAKRAPVRKKPVNAVLLNNIQFTDVSPTLKEFWEEKNPENVTAQVLVMAYWFKNHKNLSDLSLDHFHTAYRWLGMATPTGTYGTLHELKKQRSGKMQAGSTGSNFCISLLGENTVIEMNRDA